MEVLLLSLVAFLASILTFFSGFGLGTILARVFMLFFPVDVAIALTGIVHLFNNLFKLFLVGRKTDWSVFLRFGIPAILAALLGSWLLLRISDFEPVYSYEIAGKQFDIYFVKLVIGILLMLFAIMDLIPRFEKMAFNQKMLPVGGLLSGFFGGLTGNQGAFRSAFLIKAGMTKEVFIGTAVAVSTAVDFTRLGVYSTRLFEIDIIQNSTILLCATLSAILGAWIGNKLLKKVTLRFLQVVIAVMLILFSILLGLGVI